MQLHTCSAGASTNKDQSAATASLKVAVRLSEIDKSNAPTTFRNSQHREDTASITLLLAGATAKKCLVGVCKHKRSFKSAYELTRHVQTVHGARSAKSFVCGARGCFNGHLPWSFARSDKLTSHIKTVHKYDTVFNQCPVAECSFGPCPLEVLGVHIQYAHRNLEEGRAVLNATPCKARRCPMWRCGKHIATDKLMAHILAHASEDIEAAKSSLELDGFLVESTFQGGITVRAVCPVCRTVTADAKQFVRHLATDHLYVPNSGGYKHFEQWKTHWKENGPKWKSEVSTLLPWSRITHFPVYDRRVDYQCPYCPFSAKDVRGIHMLHERRDQQSKRVLIQEHHRSFLRPEAEVVSELCHHRMAILRLWPEFVTHPVFADFNTLPQKSIAGLGETQGSPVRQQQNDFEILRGTADDFDASS